MIQKLVAAALRQSTIVVVLALALVAGGLLAYARLDVEAYPNPVAPMVEVITQPVGLSAEEVERYVTIPLEVGLSGIVDLDHIRSQSLFGLSDVKVYFNWTPDYYTAQQRVLNRLSFVTLPNSLTPQLSPWNAIGELYRYQLVGPGYSLEELKTAEDWIMEKQWRQVPGVIDVVSFGGLTRQYQVELDPFRLKGEGVTLTQVINSIGNANQNVGGGTLNVGPQAFNVRGVGLIHSLRDITDITVAEKNGTAVRVGDLGQVHTGAAPRLGIVGRDDQPDIVQGTVLMRYGGESLSTLKGIHDRVERIRQLHLLPPGMEIVTYYDRTKLVNITTHTVLENLLVGMVLVSLVLWAFLGHVKAALVTAINIPLALLVAFIGMVATGTPANLISLGAVDFGIVVDSTVIMVENIFRRLSRPIEGVDRAGNIAAAAGEISTPLFFSTLIIATAFVPLFTLNGVAGVIFAPMAHTYAFAIGGALCLALTLTPVLANRFLDVTPAPHLSEEEAHSNWLMRFFDRVYGPLFAFAIRRKGWAVALAAFPVVLAAALSPILGREFMPKLEEGNFWIRASLPVSVSLDESSRAVGKIRRIVLGCPVDEECTPERRRRPEIATVVSQLGRPDDGTDPVGFYNIELFVPLTPSSKWRKGMTKEKLTDEMSSALKEAFPGVVFNFSQVIADNVEEAMSGVKGENTIKVVGPDIKVDEQKAQEIYQVMRGVRGVEDLGIFRSLGQPNVRITPDRVACGRYGINAGDVGAVVQAAIGGQAVTQVYEGERHFDLTVRWRPEDRRNLAVIRDIPVPTPDGTTVPLGTVAQVTEEEGPSLIYREDQQRYVPVKFSVRRRDLASTIEEARAGIAERVRLPYDTHLEWAGEINELKETNQRLVVIVPLTVLLIAFLVYTSVKDWKDTLIVLGGLPVAISGGVLALIVTGTNFSISAAMGFISIFGIAVQDALIVVTYAQRLWAEGHTVEEGALLAAKRRLRPVLMTTSVAMFGLTPAALSRGIGSETQRPLAIVVIGGALILALVPRLLQPALLVYAHRRKERAPGPGAAAPPLEPATVP
ncbi:MAG: efflux RND transporter permease subunit [Myxococcaceae bacterium]